MSGNVQQPGLVGKYAQTQYPNRFRIRFTDARFVFAALIHFGPREPCLARYTENSVGLSSNPGTGRKKGGFGKDGGYEILLSYSVSRKIISQALSLKGALERFYLKCLILGRAFLFCCVALPQPTVAFLRPSGNARGGKARDYYRVDR